MKLRKRDNKIVMQKLSKSDSDTLLSDVSRTFDLKSCQLYNPIFSNYMTYYNNNYANNAFQIKSKYTMISCNRTEDNITGKIVKNYTQGNTKNSWNAKVFVKLNPLLDVDLYIKNFYSTHVNQDLMPNKYIQTTINKLNSPNNSGYIEAFSLFTLSRLTETGKCPLFPYYYGTYNGIAKSFKYEITDEYRSLYRNKWFVENKDKLFTLVEDKYNDFDDVFESEEDTDITMTIKNDEGDIKMKDLDFDMDDIDWSEHEGTGHIEHLNEDYNMNSRYFVLVNDFPVQLISMEKLELTLDQYVMTHDGNIDEEEWFSILFQICFGMAVAQKDVWFTHNDLHGNNIMFKKTKDEYLYFHYDDQYFRVPTYGKITKVIDFARSIVKVEDKIYFSDVFRKDGHAEGQYSYPYRHYNFDMAKHKPNMSFDLARLATTISHNLSNNSDVYGLLLGWMTDRYGNNLGKDEDNFELYVKIARNVDNSIPEKQIKKSVFNIFHINKSDIPSKTFVYYF